MEAKSGYFFYPVTEQDRIQFFTVNTIFKMASSQSRARCKFRAFYVRRPVAYIPRGVLDTRVNLDTRAGYKWTGKFDLNTNTSGRGNF